MSARAPGTVPPAAWETAAQTTRGSRGSRALRSRAQVRKPYQRRGRGGWQLSASAGWGGALPLSWPLAPGLIDARHACRARPQPRSYAEPSRLGMLNGERAAPVKVRPPPLATRAAPLECTQAHALHSSAREGLPQVSHTHTVR